MHNVTTMGINSPPYRRTTTPANGVVGMLLFVVTEIMFFAGLISAFIVTRAGVVWPPPDQPRLPVEATAINTLILLASGFALRRAHAAFVNFDLDQTRKLLALAIGLGALFVTFQGYEWIRLISFGLTMRSSTYGSFFYLLIGAHALHAVAAIIALIYCWRQLTRSELSRVRFSAVQVFWYFVVLLWPILYVLVYVL
ncbi:MAG: heme-copper oxidase subunit III [Deltaproteobacteria bacterium]|nr:heme-copper oxidase subunit III [Deltaproteobacteria bacterium]